MNERIRELAGQAGAGINYTDNGEPFGVHFNKYETFEKFADLIVRECIRKIEDIAESSNDPQPIYRVAVELLEHFGVEE